MVVAKSHYKDVDQLIEQVQRCGQRLVRAQTHELVIGNIVRRILRLIRDEMAEDRNEFGTDSISDLQSLTPDAAPHPEPKVPTVALPVLNRAPTLPSTSLAPFSLLNLLSSPTDHLTSGSGTPMGRSGTSTPMFHGQSSNILSLKSEVLDGIDEIRDEIDQVDDLIAGYADTHIHPSDYVLVHEPDATVEKFLSRAARERKYTILKVEGVSRVPMTAEKKASPSAFRNKLQGASIKMIDVSNAGLTAYMTRVDRVVLSARAVTARGGVVVEAGGAALARAAHEFGKPVIVLMGIYRLSSENPANIRDLIEWGKPDSYVSYSQGNMVNDVQVEVPVTEFVPASLVDMYISNM